MAISLATLAGVEYCRPASRLRGVEVGGPCAGERHRGPARRDLLEHLQVDLVRLVAAAPLGGLGQAQQPGRTELAEHPVGIRLGFLVGVDDRGQHLVGDVAGQSDEVSRSSEGSRRSTGMRNAYRTTMPAAPSCYAELADHAVGI